MGLSRLCGALVLLVLLTSAGAALNLGISSEKAWVVAGGDVAKVSLEIRGGSGSFAITASTAPDGMCTVNPTSLTTTSNRPPPLELRSRERSGVCELSVSVTDTSGTTVTQKLLQNIDHTTPMTWERIAQQSATVGTVIPVGVRLRDVYGNPVENRNVAETVTFSTSGSSGFVDGPSSKPASRTGSATAPVDGNGIASVWYYVGSFDSPNYITVKPPGEIGPQIMTIVGLLDGAPSIISSRVSPSSTAIPWIFADGSSKFIVTYTVLDASGFPVEAAGVRVSTSEGATLDLLTNSLGQASYYYGPFSMAGKHTVTGALAGNPRVTVINTMETVAMGPDHLLATGNPLSMPSLDVSASSRSTISGRVSDAVGNPAKNEKVTFQLTAIAPHKALKADPYLTDGKKTYTMGSPVTVTTNNDGNAVITFVPGRFASSLSDKDYDPAARTTATVTATWGSKTETLTLTFQRSGALFLQTTVEPRVLAVGDTFDVTVNVSGDGKMIRKNPVQVMLVDDCSGSMRSRMPDGKTRFYWVQQASYGFLQTMNADTDKVGLTTFHTWATHEQDLTSDFPTVAKKIDGVQIPVANAWTVGKGPEGYTNIREGLFNATSYLKNYGNKDPKVTKAIILLTDGTWNYGGTPLATGRGYADRTRLAVWTDTLWGADCSSKTSCYNTFYDDTFYWWGLPSFNVYTYFNATRWTDLAGNPIMNAPGTTVFTGEGQGPAKRFDGPDGSNGYLCHPNIPKYKDNGPSWAYYTCTEGDQCSGTIGCYADQKFRVDVCDPSIAGSMDCSNTEQNMAIFAKNNNIRVYTITYAEADFLTSDKPGIRGVREALQLISATTGGKYYHAATGQDLEKVYEDIATDLSNEAGIDPSFLADNTELPELQNGGTVLGSDAFDFVDLPNNNPLPLPVTQKWDRSKTPPIEGPTYQKDMKLNWDRTHQIKLPISSMKVGQTWQLKYRLSAKKAGTYDVFGKDSILTWKDWEGESQRSTFPPTPVTVLEPGTKPSDARLVLYDLAATPVTGTRIMENEPFILDWWLHYEDTNSNGRANLKIRIYSSDGKGYDSRMVNYPDEKPPNKDVDYHLSYPWQAGLPAGQYTAKVWAANDANNANAVPIDISLWVEFDPNRAKIILR
jgi:von Willebrand factor type A domain